MRRTSEALGLRANVHGEHMLLLSLCVCVMGRVGGCVGVWGGGILRIGDISLRMLVRTSSTRLDRTVDLKINRSSLVSEDQDHHFRQTPRQ